MPKYISGRVKTTPVSGLTSDRYRYLSLADAEPSLGDPTVGPSSIGAKPIQSGTQYIIVAVEGRPGERYWIQNQADVTPGSISVFEEGTLVGGLSSTTQLDFRGTAITAEGLGGANPGYAVTITLVPPGNEKEVIFKESNDFATDTTFTFDSTQNLLAAGDRITVGAGGTVITTTASGFVGIGTTDPTGDLTATYDPNLHVEGNIRLTGTIIDRLGDAGTAGFLLVKEDDIFGGLSWTDPANITFGGAGDYRQVQFKGSTGLLEGADFLYYDEVNNFVGIGSTQPTVRLDVIGTSNFDGDVTVERNFYVGGISTFFGNSVFTGNIDANGNLDVDGQTDLDVLNVSQLATFSGNIDANGNLDVDGQTDLDVLNVSQLATFSANLDINASVDIQNNLDVGGTLDVTGATDLASAGGITTTGGDLYVGNDLYVAGTFNITDLEAETGNFTVSLDTVNFRATGISTLGNVKVSGNTVDTTGGNLILQANAANNVQSIDVRNRIVLNNDTQSTAVDNGSFETTGGVGIAKNLNVGGEVSFTGDGSGVDVTLASAGGITTTGGDLYVGGDFYVNQDANFKDLTVETLTVSVAATIANLTLDNPGIAVTAILDEDDMISNRDDALATQQSIKAYVDTQVGNQDLDFVGDNGVPGAVDLDTQVFDISGVSGDTVTSSSGQTLTIASDVTGVTAGTYGSATRVGIITVNDKGKITAASDVDIDLSNATAAFADRLTTPRTISFSEDVVAVGKTFDGSQDVGFALTLTSVFDGGTYGGEGNKVLSLTVDDKGRITGITSVAIDFGLANVATADSLTNAREIAATGDIDWSVSFKGHEDVSGIATLSNTGVTSDTYGSSTQIPVITVDAKGRITGVGLTDVDGGGGGGGDADRVSTGTTTPPSPSQLYYLTFVDSNNNPRSAEDLYTDGQLIYQASTDTLNPLNLTVTLDTDLNGNVTIGDSPTDTLTVNASVGSTIAPDTTNTYDLGSSPSLRWKTVYADTICADNYCGAVITGSASDVSIATTTGGQEPYYLTFVANTSGAQPLYADSGLRYYPVTDELALDSNLLICDNKTVCVGDSKEFGLTYCVGDFAYDSTGTLEGSPIGICSNRYDFSGNLITDARKGAIFEETGKGPMLFRALGTGQGAFQFFSTESSGGAVNWVSLLKMHGGRRGFRLFQCDANLEVVNVTGTGVTVAGNIVPWVGDNPQNDGARISIASTFSSGDFNLGSPTKRWGNVYACNIDIVGNITGSLSGNADTVSTGTTTGTGDYFLTFVDSNNNPRSAENLYTDLEIKYNPNTNTLNPTNLTVANCLTVENDARICGTLDIGSATVSINGSTNTITVGTGVVINETTSCFNNVSVQSITPKTGSTYDLGASGNRFDTIYADTLDATNITGSISGSANQIETQCTTSNATYYLTFVDSNNASSTAETLYTNGVTYNPNNNRFTIDGYLCTNVGGGSNSVFGDSTTGDALTTGNDNVLIGGSAGRFLTTGSQNIFVGDQAGGSTNVNACRNIFLGSYSGWQAGVESVYCTSQFNVAVGYFAGECISGCFHTAMGPHAGGSACGCCNVFIGQCAGYSGIHLEDIMIGCGAGGRPSGASGQRHIFIGCQAGYCSTGTNNNTFIGRGAGYYSTTGANNIAIGRRAGDETMFNFSGAPTTANHIIMGNNDHTRACIKIAWSLHSDIRHKCVWGSVPHGREFLRGVNPIKYSFKDEDTNDIIDETVRYGFSAQEILALEGDTPVIASNDVNQDSYGVTTDYIIPVLVNAIKELDTENTELRQRIVAIEQHLGL